jgi:hypothetical protein
MMTHTPTLVYIQKQTNEVTDMIWVLLRSLTRPMVEVPVKANVLEQVVRQMSFGINNLDCDLEIS